MRHLLLVLLLTLPGPALSQRYEPPATTEDVAPSQDEDTGGIVQRNIESLFGDLFNNLRPHMDAIGREVGGTLSELQPIMEDLTNMVDDIRNYQAPERLANGDILIRRHPDAPPPPPISKQLQDLTTPKPGDPSEGGPKPKTLSPAPDNQIDL